MKLMKSTTSPYGRMAHAMLIEAQVEPLEVELLNPWADPPQLLDLNPASRVPTLVLDDGTVLTESLVIAMFARDAAPPGSHLKSARAQGYAVAGLAFGVIDAAVNIMAGRKITSDDLADPAFDTHPIAERRRRTMVTGLGRLEPMVDALDADAPGVAEIALVDAVQYMDFRFPGAPWRPSIPRIDAFAQGLAGRRSIAETVPS